jgi:hypothetical protein
MMQVVKRMLGGFTAWEITPLYRKLDGPQRRLDTVVAKRNIPTFFENQTPAGKGGPK